MSNWKIRLGIVAFLLLAYFFFNPPRFWLNLIKRVEPTPEVGDMLVQKYGCRNCHSIGGRGAQKAPSLHGITDNPKDPALVTIRLWLRNPKSIKRDTAMPNFRLSDSEIEAVISHLKLLDDQRLNRLR